MSDDLTKAAPAVASSVLFAVVLGVIVALLWTAVQSQSGVWILLLKFLENLRSNLVNLGLGHCSWRQKWHHLLKQPFDDTKTPLTHNEGLWNIDSSDGDRHSLWMVWGGDFVIRAVDWPGLYVVFPDVTRQKRCEKPEKKTANSGKNKVPDLEIPARLKLRSPSQVLASRTLDDSTKSNICDINGFPALGAIEIISNPLSDPNGCAVNESRESWIRHGDGIQVSANVPDQATAKGKL